MTKLLTTAQEIYFDMCDLIDSGAIDDIALPEDELGEFETVLEFMQEQRRKIEKIKDALEEGAKQ